MLVPHVQWSGMASVLCVYYCTVYTVRVPLVQWFSMVSTDRVPIGLCFNSYCGCTIAQCIPCLYLLYSGLAWPARVMYVLPVFVLVTVRVLLLHSVYCACTSCTGFSMASTGRVPIGPCFYSYRGCTIAHCVPCLYLMYSGLAWPTRVMYVLPVFVLVTVRVLLHGVYCACTPCTVA